MRGKMPRPRKYDYKKDYPVKMFCTFPVKLVNDLEELGYQGKKFDKLVEKLLLDFVENNRKID